MELAHQGMIERPAADPATWGSCHLDVVAAWLETPHQRAFTGEAFQQAWAAGQQPTDCLTCHTTGLVRRTGTFAYASVSCTACHGETPPDHPREPIAVDPGPEVCADCHQTTFTDWERSVHSEVVACSDCHTVHPHGLLAETADALCLSCHTDSLTSHVHSSQSETEEGRENRDRSVSLRLARRDRWKYSRRTWHDVRAARSPAGPGQPPAAARVHPPARSGCGDRRARDRDRRFRPRPANRP